MTDFSESMRAYLGRGDRHTLDEQLPGYEDGPDEDEALDELQELWDELMGYERSEVCHQQYRSDHLSPIEREILKEQP